MAGKSFLKLYDFEGESFFEEDLNRDEVLEKITVNFGENLDKDEIPLEYEGHAIGSIKINQDHGQVKGTVDISKSVMELLLRKAFLIEEQQRESQAKELLVSLLLNQKSRDIDPTLDMMGRILGYNLEEHQVVFVVEFEKKEDFDDKSPEWERLRSTAIKVIEGFFKFSGGFIVASFYNGRILVFKNIFLEEDARGSLTIKGSAKERSECLSKLRKQLISLAESLRQAILLGTKNDVFIGIGECHKGVSAARNSYQDACLALRMGKYFKETMQSRIFHISDFVLESLLAKVDEEEKRRYVERYLGNIKEEKELLETLEAFFQCNMNIAQAAEKSFLHRNTLTYRLDKIQHLTGLNPRCFHDAMILAIALIMKQINARRAV